jgi:hypothetical protein
VVSIAILLGLAILVFIIMWEKDKMTTAVDIPPVVQRDRFAVVRRLYFYLIALASFVTALFAVDGLLQILDFTWFDSRDAGVTAGSSSYLREMIAWNGSMLLVATPIFLIHWGYMQRQQGDLEEQQAALRKLFLYGASAVSTVFALVNGYNLLYEVGLLALGAPVVESAIWPSGWFHVAGMTAVGWGLGSYFYALARRDSDFGQEVTLAGTVRRLYKTAAGLAALLLILYNLSGLLEVGIEWLVQQFSSQLTVGSPRGQIAGGIAGVMVGAILARINWRRWQAVQARFPAETRTALRRFYLYVGVVVGAVATLAPAADMLNQLLRILFGAWYTTPIDWANLFTRNLTVIPIGLIIWIWFGRQLQEEEAIAGESLEGATIRRLYYYVVAATGLVLTWIGLQELVLAGLNVLLAPPSVEVAGDRTVWAAPLANGLSLLAFGAPVWSYHWRAGEQVARQDTPEGARERASGPRKVYLYGVALVGSLLILYFLASVVYQLLLLAIGDPDASLQTVWFAEQLASTLIAGGLWAMHLLAIRADMRMGSDTAAGAIDIEERYTALQERVTQLQAALAAAQADLIEFETSHPERFEPR